MRLRRTTVLVLAVAASLMAACSSGGGKRSDDDAAARGPITFAQTAANSPYLTALAKLWNGQHPDAKVTIVTVGGRGDEQRVNLAQHLADHDANYDVVGLDTTWIAEFASQGWLQPLKGDYGLDTSQLLPVTATAASHDGTLYGAPVSSDAGLLYYRTDLVPKPPSTWAEVIADCKKAPVGMSCYAGQYEEGEDLTVNAIEAVRSAGGQVMSADGRTPTLDSDAAKKGLAFLTDGFAQGYIPKPALTYGSTETASAFANGQLMFMRDWSSVYPAVAAASTSKVKGKVGVAALPGLSSPGVSVLGGQDAAINAAGKHKRTALAFLKFMLSPESQKSGLELGGQAPTLASLYSDPALVAKQPYLPALLKSSQSAAIRPQSPFYPKITSAIQQNLYSALQGSASLDAAIAATQSALKDVSGG